MISIYYIYKYIYIYIYIYNYNVFVSTKMYLLIKSVFVIISTMIFFKVIVGVSIIGKKCVIVIVSIIYYLSIVTSSGCIRLDNL